MLGAAAVLAALPVRGLRAGLAAALAVLTLASASLLRYALGSAPPYSVEGGGFVPMALGTATGFLLLALVAVDVLPSAATGLLAPRADPARRAFHRLLAGLLGVLVVVGELTIVGQQRGWFGSAAGAALQLAAAAVLVSLVALVQVGRLRQAENLADSLFRLAPDAVLLIAPDGRIGRVNEAAEVLIGARAAELEGQPVEVLVPPEVRHPHVGHRSTFAAAPQRRMMGRGRELVVLCRDGRRVMADISLGPVPRADGTWTLVSVRDASERRRARPELQARLVEVEALNQELEAFSYSVSHDLREPLRVVDGFARVLVEDQAAALDTEPRRLVQVILEQTELMRRLIDELLRLSRFSRQPPEVERVDTAELVGGVIAGLDLPATAEVSCGPLPDAIGDPHLLRQVWANYLGNAVKFSSGRTIPRLRVEGREGATEAIYAVHDNGVGFDPAHAEHLFVAFHRQHSANEFPGTGIGLALVKRIVHRHGGRAWAEGRPGEGASFYFSLPSGAGALPVDGESAPELAGADPASTGAAS